MAMSKREARRERNREDFRRATTASVQESGHKMPHGSSAPGSCAGNTYQEHIEDEIRKAVRALHRVTAEIEKAADDSTADMWSNTGLEVKRKAARGVIRGLTKALLIYEDSYDMDNKHRLLQMEKEFLNEGKES
jgi:hypothetical protein